MTENLEEIKTVFRQSNARLGFASSYEEVAEQLQPGEHLKSAVKVRSLWLSGDLVGGTSPILLLTDMRLIVMSFDRLSGLVKAKVKFASLELNQLQNVSPYAKGFFEIGGNGELALKVRRMGSWSGMRNTARFYRILLETKTGG